MNGSTISAASASPACSAAGIRSNGICLNWILPTSTPAVPSTERAASAPTSSGMFTAIFGAFFAVGTV